MTRRVLIGSIMVISMVSTSGWSEQCWVRQATCCGWQPFLQRCCSACSRLLSLRSGGGGDHEVRLDSTVHVESTLAKAHEPAMGLTEHTDDLRRIPMESSLHRLLSYVVSAVCRCAHDGCKVIAAVCMVRSNAVHSVISTSAWTEFFVTTPDGTVSNHQIFSARQPSNVRAATTECCTRNWSSTWSGNTASISILRAVGTRWWQRCAVAGPTIG